MSDSTSRPKLHLERVNSETPFDAEFASYDSNVSVVFVLPNDEKLELKFSSGDTALTLKKRLFDLYDIGYEYLTLKYGSTELIDPLSICDTPALKGLKSFSLTVSVPAEIWAKALQHQQQQRAAAAADDDEHHKEHGHHHHKHDHDHDHHQSK